MRISARRRLASGLSAALLLTGLAGFAGGASTSSAQAAIDPGCVQPLGKQAFTPASPADHGVDPTAVAAAIKFAEDNLRWNVRIMRDGCEIGASTRNANTDDKPFELFSGTKQFVSLLTGIAWAQGKIDLEAPIGRYLPAGYGDAAHRAITVKQLLTDTSGLDEAILSEAATFGNDPNLALEALAQPIVDKPGTRFRYSQRVPDLLGFVVERAVAEDLQDFAQRELFDKLQITSKDFYWRRDRAGISYGYMGMGQTPRTLAKLGELLLNDGQWRGEQVVPADYVRLIQEPSATNGCWSLMFWTNAGDFCVSASVPQQTTIRTHPIQSAPRDLYMLWGALNQNVFVIPSLNMSITWTGLGAKPAPNAQELLTSTMYQQVYHDFFRILMRGVVGTPVADPGPFRRDLAVEKATDTGPIDDAIWWRDQYPTSTCSIWWCAKKPGF